MKGPFSYYSNRRGLMGLLVLSFVLLALWGTSGVWAGEKTSRLISEVSSGNKAIAEKLALAQANQRFLQEVEQRVQVLKQDQVFRKKMAEYPAGKKIAAFLHAMEKDAARGYKVKAYLRTLTDKRKARLNQVTSGSISGTVTVEGQPPFQDAVEVFAFDERGFFAGSADADNVTGAYSIDGLADGSYYVTTSSDLVDEFYDNVPLDGFESWRNASLVTVAGGAVTGIDFDLERGATVSGHIFRADGTTPIAFNSVTFTLFSVDRPGEQVEATAFTDGDGAYEINVPAAGNFKMQAEVLGFQTEFWDNKPDLASADIITISSTSDVISNIDFSLEEGGGAVEGSTIAGSVTGPGSVPLPFAFIFTFDTADTSISGFGISGFDGLYQVQGLSAGNHVLFADWLLGLIQPPALRGEYYNDAPTSAQATPVAVDGMNTVDNIDFVLEPGGSIAGTITDSNGAALDSVLVIAVKQFSLDNIGKFFFDAIDIGIAFSDADGAYEVGGLSAGNYILRTVSLLSPSAGQVLDEYFQDVQNLFDFDQATPVAVNDGQMTAGIDFELEIAGAIAGHFFETDATTPIQGNAVAVVFDAQSGLPELALPTFDPSDGSYEVRPLPSGDFKLLGFVLPNDSLGGLFGGASVLNAIAKGQRDFRVEQNDIIYIPQFYDGKATFEDADIVSVVTPNVTTDIDFKMVRAATIEGVVNLSPGFPTGADSLDERPVVAFRTDTGQMAGIGTTTFAGGYRIVGLPPGQYKVVALSATDGYAGTYFGGGTTFDDPNSTPVTVGPDATFTADIDLGDGQGTITGMVTTVDGQPLNGVMVIAYDGTGHAVSAGLSGLDINTDLPLATPGLYRIEGLPAGSYFLRTFSLFQIFLALENLNLGDNLGGGDPLTILFGLLGSSDQLLQGLNIQLFADAWYPNELIGADLGNVDIFSLLFGLLFGGGDIQSLLPFFDTVPSGASAVTVSSPGVQDNIDFQLPNLVDLLVSVEETPEESLIPTAFRLSQNYPNPFNPTTQINYDVPRTSQVSLKVYNMLGQHVKTLFEGRKEAGHYAVKWDGSNQRGEQVSAGIYFLRMVSEGVTLSRKMLLVK